MSFRTKLLNYFGSRDRAWVLTLFAVVSLLYLPFLSSPFVFDDLNLFSGNVAKLYGHSWFHFDLRWLPYASLGWTTLLFSDVITHFFHLGNLLLHAANVILLFYLLRHLLAAAMPGDHAPVRAWGAWSGALIFAVHPVAVYAVGYVVQRSILMATLFALAMQLAYLRGLLTGKRRWLALAALAYFLAVFSKEHSVMMPAVLAAMTILLRDRMKVGVRPLLLTWCVFAAIGLLVILRQQGVFGTPYEPMANALFEQQGIVGSTPVLYLLSVLTQAGLFFKYLLLWLLPNPAWMSIDMREPFVSSMADWAGWLGGGGFVLYGYVGLRLLLRGGARGLIGWALLYPWLQFILEFSSIRVQEPFVLYRSYLWMPGLLLLLPLLLMRWPGWRTRVALMVVLLLLVPAAVNREWVMADNYRLWNDAAKLLPNERVAGADRIYFNLGQAKAGLGRHEEAIADFQRVLSVSPQYAPVHYELGWQYGILKRYDDALTQFDAAIALDPAYANAYFGKAMVMKMRHDNKQATELMTKSCELKHEIACLIVKGYIQR